MAILISFFILTLVFCLMVFGKPMLNWFKTFEPVQAEVDRQIEVVLEKLEVIKLELKEKPAATRKDLLLAEFDRKLSELEQFVSSAMFDVQKYLDNLNELAELRK